MPQYRVGQIEFHGDLTLVNVLISEDFGEDHYVKMTCQYTTTPARYLGKTLEKISEEAISYAQKVVPSIPNPETV